MNRQNQRKTTTKKVHQRPDITEFMSVKKVGGPNKPDEVNRNVTATVKFAYTPSTTAARAFTPNDILVKVPGNILSAAPGSAPIYWTHMRLVKVSVWGLGTGSGASAPIVSVEFSNDPRRITDEGVQGANAAAVHVRPPMQTMQTWYPGTDATTQLFTTSTSGGGEVIYITAQLLSAGATSGN